MKFKFLLFLFLAMAGFVSAQSTAPTPQLGDFQSVTSGAWTSPTTWQVYNGSNWVATTDYPGKGTTALSQATYSVFVQPGTTVEISGTQTYYFGNLYILASPIPNSVNASTVSYGKVSLIGNASSLELLGSNQDLIILGGTMEFRDPQTQLKLKSGSSVVLKYYNGATCGTGTNLLQPEGSGGTGDKNIVFTDGTTAHNYAVSGGAGNSPYTFADLNCNGGSLGVNLSAAPNPVCAGKAVTLTSGLTGFVSAADSTAPKTYVWTSASGSTVTTYSANTPNLNVTLTTPGTHVFKVVVSYVSALGFTISADQTINVEVLATGDPLCSGCFKDPALDTTKHPSVHGITSLKRAGAANGDNWPMVRESAYTVLESNTKGFVINRLTTAQLNAIETAGNAVDGMMAYDTTAKCLKLYVADLANPANTGWSCFTTPACPN